MIYKIAKNITTNNMWLYTENFEECSVKYITDYIDNASFEFIQSRYKTTKNWSFKNSIDIIGHLYTL